MRLSAPGLGLGRGRGGTGAGRSRLIPITQQKLLAVSDKVAPVISPFRRAQHGCSLTRKAVFQGALSGLPGLVAQRAGANAASARRPEPLESTITLVLPIALRPTPLAHGSVVWK